MDTRFYIKKIVNENAILKPHEPVNTREFGSSWEVVNELKKVGLIPQQKAIEKLEKVIEENDFTEYGNSLLLKHYSIKNTDTKNLLFKYDEIFNEDFDFIDINPITNTQLDNAYQPYKYLNVESIVERIENIVNDEDDEFDEYDDDDDFEGYDDFEDETTNVEKYEALMNIVKTYNLYTFELTNTLLLDTEDAYRSIKTNQTSKDNYTDLCRLLEDPESSIEYIIYGKSKQTYDVLDDHAVELLKELIINELQRKVREG